MKDEEKKERCDNLGSLLTNKADLEDEPKELTK